MTGSLHPAARRLRSLLPLIGLVALSACTAAPPAPTEPIPTVTATVTATATATVTVTPSADPSDDLTGVPEGDEAAKSARAHTAEDDAARWRLVSDLLDQSDSSGRPLIKKFDAVIRSADYNQTAAGGLHLTLTLDKVRWNPAYTDGGDAEVVLNPKVSWEKLRAGDLLVLVNPGDGPHQVPSTDLPAMFKAELARSKEYNDGWTTPYSVYFIGSEPVALVEWYVP